MNFYLVFGSTKRPVDFFGGKALDWSNPPIGVYQANSPEEACQAAAKDHGQMATYFAVPGTPWGIDLIDAPAQQLGRSENSQDRLNRLLARMEANDEKLAQIEAAKTAERGVREATPAERIAAAEARSRELEHEVLDVDDSGEEH